jgi:murein DD-endopeptidase MepM/ murein hydrolase activator NlpD
VSHRRHARPNRGQPSASRFLPPQPLSERDRGSGIAARLGRRSGAALIAALLVAVIVPLVFAVLGPAGRTLQPLGGDVRGAVASEGPGPSRIPPAAVDARFDRVRAAVPDGSAMALRAAPAIATLTGYQWPIPGGEWINDGKLFHDGVDMATFCGAPVGAAHDGVVLAAGRHFDEQIGWLGDLRPYFHVLDVRHMWGDLPIVVVIDDGNGYRSIYAHFQDVTVRVGQRVKAGQLIGHEGATGHASGCHVHYGLFSPYETSTFGVRADILRSLKVPTLEIARIDPLAVLPGGDVALRTRSVAKAIAAAKLALAGPVAGLSRPARSVAR